MNVIQKILHFFITCFRFISAVFRVRWEKRVKSVKGKTDSGDCHGAKVKELRRK